MAGKISVEEYLDNPNVRATLDIISKTEGTYDKGDNGYNIAFGGGTFDSYAAHPNMRREFTQTDGKKNESSAAGRYQTIKATADENMKELGLTDFSPRSQDLIAINLLRKRGALGAVLAGDLQGGLSKLGQEWASLPTSTYPQGKVSQGALDKLIGASGTQAASTAPAMTTSELMNPRPPAPFVGLGPRTAPNANQAPVIPENAIQLGGAFVTPDNPQEAAAVNYAKSQPPQVQESMVNLLSLIQANTVNDAATESAGYVVPDIISSYFRNLLNRG